MIPSQVEMVSIDKTKWGEFFFLEQNLVDVEEETNTATVHTMASMLVLPPRDGRWQYVVLFTFFSKSHRPAPSTTTTRNRNVSLSPHF